MKTISIKFNENSKEYNFNTIDETIKTNDFVIVPTANGFKIVKVVNDNINFEQEHTNIVCKVTADLPNFRFFSLYELIEYKDKTYKHIIRYERKNNVQRLLSYILDTNYYMKKKLYIDVQNFADDPIVTYSIDSFYDHDDFTINFIKENENLFNNYKDSSELFNLSINNQSKELLNKLNNIELSFKAREEKDDYDFIYHPVRTLIKELLFDNDNYKYFIKKINDNDDIDDVPVDCPPIRIFKYEREPDENSDIEYLHYYNKLMKAIEEDYNSIDQNEYIDEENGEYGFTLDDYISDILDDVCYSDLDYDCFINNFEIIIYEENINNTKTKINPILKFGLQHFVDNTLKNLYANDNDVYNFNYQTLDLIFDN